MLDKLNETDVFLSIGASVITFLVGDYDLPLRILIGAICLDYASGFLKALYFKNPDSSIGSKGLIKKMNILLCVAVAHLVDSLTGASLMRNPVIYCFVLNECWSIVENSGQMGLKVPKFLKSRIKGLDTSDEEELASTKDDSK